MKEIYERHHVGRRFMSKSYKDALKDLKEKGSIACEPPKVKRKKGTFGDDVKVTFPSGGNR